MANPRVEVLPIEQAATTDLNNINAHTQRGRGLHENSLRKRGINRPIAAAGKGVKMPVISAGNQTFEIAAGIGITEAIVVHTTGNQIIINCRDDVAPGSPEFYALAIEDNAVGRESYNPDLDILAAVMADPAMQALKNEDKMLADIVSGMGLKEETKDAEPQIDSAAELQEKWRVKTGDLWQIGEHKLHCASFEDVKFQSSTLIFDPPWDIDVVFNHAQYKDILAFTDGQRVGDIVNRFGAPTWEFIWHTGGNLYIPNRPLKGHKSCYWYGDVNKYNWEGSFYGEPIKEQNASSAKGSYHFVPDPRGKHLADLFTLAISKEHAEGASHSKPLDWMRLLIANCTTGDIDDPFCGTGTSIIAAQQLGRRCVASENNPLQCALILERAEIFGIKEITRCSARHTSDLGNLSAGTVVSHV